MRTTDRITIAAPAERVLALATDVERWPVLLPHYRWVKVLERRDALRVVEMAAWRPFGPFGYPTWWVSEMWLEPATTIIRYRHIRGITGGMAVAWTIQARNQATEVTIVHDWAGPAWPLIGRVVAEWIIGPVFVHGIASRTLLGIKRAAEEA